MKRIQGSYRDPSGYVFTLDDTIYRRVNTCYAKQYDKLVDSNLYNALISNGYLVEHEEIHNADMWDADTYKILKPARITFISNPYEWSFSQLRDAALMTLTIQDLALQHGMTLKDASAYNMQFMGASPVFIDSLSFELLDEGTPWVAYRQFCMHFLAPLALASKCDHRLIRLLQTFLEGIPLPMAASMLPFSARFSPTLFTHIFMQAKAELIYLKKSSHTEPSKGYSLFKQRALVDNLRSAVSNLRTPESSSIWSDYNQNTNYSDGALDQKKTVVAEILRKLAPDTVLDLGANTGRFSRLCPESSYVISLDGDCQAVQQNYRTLQSSNRSSILPLVGDICAPSPGLGWANEERASLVDRGPFHTVLALAVIHHLAFSGNIPLPMVAEFLSRIANNLVIEFVPKKDSQIQRMLKTKTLEYENYTRENFEKAFSKYFSLAETFPLQGSERTIHVMHSL